MATTKYSHAFLVGSFNGKITPQELDKDWERVNNQEEYEWICSIYYKGHVDAMLDVNDSRPAFLKDVCHYKLTFDEVDDNGEKSVGKKIEMKMKTTKFLAVLAVFAMAFASFAVLGAGQSDAGEEGQLFSSEG